MARWFLGLALALPLLAGEAVLVDRWFVGRLGIVEQAPQPMLSMHLVGRPLPEGGRETLIETLVALRRPLAGREWRLELRRRQEEREDAEGRLTSLRIEQEADGVRTLAVASVEDGRLVGEVQRHGQRRRSEQPLPEGLPLLGTLAAFERLAAVQPSPPDGLRTAIADLVGAELAVGAQRARFLGIEDDGGLRFEVASDLVPTPTTVVVSRRGDLLRMGLALGFLRLELVPAPGPVALLGAAIDAAGWIAGAGPPPRGGERERYRLPAGVRVPDDGFQRQEGDLVEVRREAEPEPLADPAPFLAREGHLETDAPELIAWVSDALAGVAGDAERVEALIAAVRGRIITRDLSVADGSALDAFRSRTGDCTEHANLLCAALRIAGIPARVEVGVLRPPQAAHWIGHAWVSAWYDGRWHHADAAYPGVPRSCYIALAEAGGARARTAGALLSALAVLMGREIASLGGEELP